MALAGARDAATGDRPLSSREFQACVAINRVAINGAITKIVHGGGGTSLISVNDHAHFEGDGNPLVTYR